MLCVFSMVASTMLIISFNTLNGYISSASGQLQLEHRSFSGPASKHNGIQHREKHHDHARPDSNATVLPPSIYPHRNTSTKFVIPPNFIINTKFGVEKEPDFIQKNILKNWGYFPGWALISDDDTSCLDKIKKTNLFNTSAISTWYTSDDTQGMYKSDVCRLAQLYLDGGIYLDNDLELTSSILDIFKGPVDIISAVSLEDDIFQAILAAPSGKRRMEKVEILSKSPK